MVNRNTLLGASLALVNVLLYAYLVSHLNWSGPLVFAISSLFLAASTFYLVWNLAMLTLFIGEVGIERLGVLGPFRASSRESTS